MRLPSRAAWLGARATNVLRQPRRLAGIGIASFLIFLGAYHLLPRGIAGVRAAVRPAATNRVDTLPLLARLTAARAAAARAQSSLDSTREAFGRAPTPTTVAALPPGDLARRDTLERAIAALSALVNRAENAPLAASYRALGESQSLAQDPRVRALVDSLLDVERERDELGGSATVDPVYVALATRANALGRAILAIGEAEVAALRRSVTALSSAAAGAAVDVPTVELPDTAQAAATLGTAHVTLVAAERGLAVARQTNMARDSVAAGERERARLAPIPTMVAAAAVVALFIAFTAALVDEMRSPRVADPSEAERLTGLRVLTVAQLHPVPADRARRAADRALTPLLDPTSDEYRILAWHLTSHWPRDGVVTVTGDNPRVAAVVGANLAAVLAVDARATLLVDTAFASEPVRGVLDLPRSPGLAAVVENRRKWSESLLTVSVGRSRSMDVLPSGARNRAMGPAESAALVADLQRAARRYDATVVVSPGIQVQKVRAGDDTVVCVVQGSTRLATLARAVTSLIDGGARVRGIVLWAGRLPPAPRTT